MPCSRTNVLDCTLPSWLGMFSFLAHIFFFGMGGILIYKFLFRGLEHRLCTSHIAFERFFFLLGLLLRFSFFFRALRHRSVRP